MRILFLLAFLVSFWFSINKTTIPFNFDTANSGKKLKLADNYKEIEDKINLLIDSTQEMRNVMSGYDDDPTISSKDY